MWLVLWLEFPVLDAAWHVWLFIALAVLLDGMLAVSAQCGVVTIGFFAYMPYFLVPFL